MVALSPVPPVDSLVALSVMRVVVYQTASPSLACKK